MKRSRFLRIALLLGLFLVAPATTGLGQLFSNWSGGASRSVVVDFLDIGQGDSILIRSPEGKSALIDAGPSRDAATQALKRKGITALDIVIVSHHHSDHYGGMDQVIRNFKPKYFMATGSSHTTKGYLKLLQTVKSEGITAVEPTKKARKIELGSVLLTVLPQPPESRDEENNNSIGVRLQYGKFSVLLTGDSEVDERQWWITHNRELISDCTILKLAHHGSHNGTNQSLAGPGPAGAGRRQPGLGQRLRPPPCRDGLVAPEERDPVPPHRPARHHHHRQQRPLLEPGQSQYRPPQGIAQRRGSGHGLRRRRESIESLVPHPHPVEVKEPMRAHGSGSVDLSRSSLAIASPSPSHSARTCSQSAAASPGSPRSSTRTARLRRVRWR